MNHPMRVSEHLAYGSFKQFLTEHTPESRQLRPGELVAAAEKNGWQVNPWVKGCPEIVTPEGKVYLHEDEFISWWFAVEGDELVIMPYPSSGYGERLIDSGIRPVSGVLQALFPIQRIPLPEEVIELPSTPWNHTVCTRDEDDEFYLLYGEYYSQSLEAMFISDAPAYAREYVEGALSERVGCQFRLVRED